MGCLALGVASVADVASAQGPVRRGLRAAGEATIEGTRRVVEGGANIVGGVAQGTANVASGVAEGTANVAGGVAQGAADVTRGVVGGTARGLAAGVDALTPGTPYQARLGANISAADAARDARWRFARHNGEWWYYSPENNWMYHRDGEWNTFAQESFQPNDQFAGQYSSAYRGPEGGDQSAQYGESTSGQQFTGYSGPVYRLQYDETGREFICHNGRRLYVEGGEGQQHQAGYGQQEMTGSPDQPTPAPAIPQDPNSPQATTSVGASAEAQSQTEGTQATGQADVSATTGQTNQAGAGDSNPAAPRDINNEPAAVPEVGVPTTPGAAQQ
jgi:hypothetical protein